MSGGDVPCPCNEFVVRVTCGAPPPDSIAAAEARGRAEERAAVVAWLRHGAPVADDWTAPETVDHLSRDIEAGDHLKGEPR